MISVCRYMMHMYAYTLVWQMHHDVSKQIKFIFQKKKEETEMINFN